jgi:NitT/TauT family transport system substrate-binding protein
LHRAQCRAAVRAIVKTQQALKQDPSLAETVGARLFPAREAALIRNLIEQDLPYYQAEISAELVTGMNTFAMRAGLLEGQAVTYDDIVATQCRALWRP